jgi:phosphoglycolate phosphatase-like HAD superfamily hydrolase
VGVLLTGEVMVAEGRYEKAARTMEDAFREAGVDVDPELVQFVQKRAREIRDKKGEAEPLFTDKQFLTELAVRYIWQAARTSKPAKRVMEFWKSSKAFGAEVLKSMPGM